MKTILDLHAELYLKELQEHEVLECFVVPMRPEKGNRVVPDFDGSQYSIRFPGCGNYLVLEELVHAALDLKYVDHDHLTRCANSDLATFLQIDDLFPTQSMSHYVLRTAHCAVHVFTNELPVVAEIFNGPST